MLKKGQVIGAPVTAGSFEDVTRDIILTANEGRGGYVCVANVHMVTTARRNTELRSAMKNAKLVTSDGMPLVWALRRRGFTYTERIAGPNLMVRICEIAEVEKLPVYFFGGSSKTIQLLQKIVAETFPTLQVVGWESPPLLPQQPEMNPAVVNRIRTSGARIVFVGLGCPKQEFWMSGYAPHLPAVLIGVGAAFDFIAGTAPRAPLWMQKSGLEWLFRLLAEPRRLWKRYLVTNTLFLWYLLIEEFGKWFAYFNMKH